MKERLKRLGKILLFTIIEVAFLIGGLAAFQGGYKVLAAGVLAVGFEAEHLVSYNVKNDRPLLSLERIPAIGLTGVALLEAVTWYEWFALLGPAPILAGIVLGAGLLLGHILELNIVNNLPPFRDLLTRLKQAIDITALEFVAGGVWVALATGGQAVLLGGIYVEHILSSRKRVQ